MIAKTMNFAITGVGGFVAPRHLRAIRDTGHKVIAALDPHDAVGILDSYDLDIPFFTEYERFSRHLELLRRGPEENRVHYVTVCSPNYLHDAHCRMALRSGADVICEKPLVINPWNLDMLAEVEAETSRRINTVLQLRVHPKLAELRERLQRERTAGTRHQVNLTYITARGNWYHRSWKGIEEKSGGVSVNIGIHFFDLLIWLFGSVEDVRMYLSEDRKMSGFMALQHADVRWFLSIDHHDLPFAAAPGEKTTYRSITVDGEEVEFSSGFTDLHTLVYRKILAGEGYGINDIRPATELTHKIRTTALSPVDTLTHDMARR